MDFVCFNIVRLVPVVSAIVLWFIKSIGFSLCIFRVHWYLFALLQADGSSYPLARLDWEVRRFVVTGWDALAQFFQIPYQNSRKSVGIGSPKDDILNPNRFRVQTPRIATSITRQRSNCLWFWP